MSNEERITNYLSEMGLKYKERGSGIWLLCPFHNETRPSLVINKDGLWHCFGCSLSGRFEKFVALLEGISMEEARRKVQRWGLNRDSNGTGDVKRRGGETDVRFLERVYTEFCSEDFVPSVLAERGLTLNDFRRFGLRVCLTSVFIKGINVFGWLLAPLVDWSGSFRGLHLRKISRGEKIFLNTARGMFWREDLLDMSRDLIFVEGMFDAIFLTKQGFNALALLGKNVSDLQLHRFLGLSWNKKVFVFLDPDALFDARRLCSRLHLLGIKSYNIIADSDPDELSVDEIAQLHNVLMKVDERGRCDEFKIIGNRE
jgi:hypothetical protein